MHLKKKVSPQKLFYSKYNFILVPSKYGSLCGCFSQTCSGLPMATTQGVRISTLRLLKIVMLITKGKNTEFFITRVSVCKNMRLLAREVVDQLHKIAFYMAIRCSF